jgi:hypothetical protein
MTLHQPPGPGSPPALRLRRPGWRDTRFLLGLGLVAVSVAIGATAFTAAARTVPVYAAADALVPGDTVTADQLVIREVRLADSAEHYLRADEPVPDGLAVIRTVAEGELVPLSAVADSEDLGLRPVAITPGDALSSGVTRGSTVDLWFVPDAEADAVAAADDADVDADESGSSAGPVELATGLTVAEVTEPSGSFTVGSAVTVHVLVPLDRLADVLAALAAEGTVEGVPVPGQAG